MSMRQAISYLDLLINMGLVLLRHLIKVTHHSLHFKFLFAHLHAAPPKGGIAMQTSTLETIAELITTSSHIVFMTGAGASKESGIPTFRDALDGHWSRYDPGELATPEAFSKDPALVTTWYDERRMAALGTTPNPGHHAISALQAHLASLGKRVTVITQNVDELHQRSGSEGVLELHGSLITWRGARSGNKVRDLPAAPFTHYPPEHTFEDGEPDVLRPDVVWFGESLPEEAFEQAKEAARQCQLYFSVGTSSVVWPAAGIVDCALKAGAQTVEINPVETFLSSEYHHVLRGPSGELLPTLLKMSFPDL